MRSNNFSKPLRSVTAAAVAVAMLSVPLAATEVTPKTLLESCGVDTSRIEITTAEGILIVRGSVADRASAQQVSEILTGSGFGRVANLVKVASTPDDEVIRRTVERALTRTRSLEGCRFAVSAHRGVVVLQGTVRHDLQKDVAADLARSVDGVRQVVTALERG